MSNERRLVGALALMIVASLASPVQAASKRQPAKHLIPASATDAPAGFKEMCLRDERLCEGPGAFSAGATVADAASVGMPGRQSPAWHLEPTGALSPERRSRGKVRSRRDTDPALTLLRTINRAVNNHTVQRSDAALYGLDEFWTRSGEGSGAAGDCEDIAIEKRIRLVEAGFPADRLSFGVVFSRGSGLHTVLVARIDAGDVVLDSRTGRIVPWYKARYRWLGVQSMGNQNDWYAPRV